MSNPNQGAYRTLYNSLKSYLATQSVTVAFGEEYQHAEEFALPFVAIYPGSCSFPASSFPGYRKVADDDFDDASNVLDNQWTLQETLSIAMWAAADPEASPAPTAVDHANAVENLRVLVLRALQNQTPTGLRFVPISGRWQTFNDQMNRYGRAFVLDVNVDITYTTAPPVDATVTSVVITTEIEAA